VSSSLIKIDGLVPSADSRRLALYAAQRNAVSRGRGELVETWGGLEEPARYEASEILASGKRIKLPHPRWAIDLYRKNIDARRTLFSGPFFVDTYA
jgi:hypothetical protein